MVIASLAVDILLGKESSYPDYYSSMASSTVVATVDPTESSRSQSEYKTQKFSGAFKYRTKCVL